MNSKKLIFQGLFLIILALIPTLTLLYQTVQLTNEDIRQMELELKGIEKLKEIKLERTSNELSEALSYWKQSEHISNVYEIILDPVSESYFIGRIVTNELPELLFTMQQYEQMLQNRNISENDKFLNKDYFIRTIQNKTQIINEDLSKIESAIKANELISKDFISILSDWIKLESEISEYIKIHKSNSLIDETKSLHTKILNSRESNTNLLWKVITLRLNEYKNKLNQKFIFVAIISMLSILLGVFLAIRVVNQLEEQAQTITNKDELIERSAKLALLGELTSGIGHEISSPLTVLTASTRQLKSRLEKNNGVITPEDLIAHQETVSRAINKMSLILQSIRNMIKNQGKGELVEISFMNNFNETMLLLEHLRKEYQVEIETSPDLLNVNVLAHQTELSQIIGNLIKNSIEALKSEVVRKIKIECVSEESYIKFYISDSGKGISKENIDKLFQPLFSTKVSSGGTGLGLSLSKKLAQHMGGDLNYVNSDKQSGACFCLKLKKA